MPPWTDPDAPRAAVASESGPRTAEAQAAAVEAEAEAAAEAPDGPGPVDDLPTGPSASETEADALATSLPLLEWRAALNEQLRAAASALLAALHSAQAQADADAALVRGEAAWRRHVAALSDRVDEAVRRELRALRTQVARHADAAREALAEGLARARQAGERALAAQGAMYQDKLRRTRLALKKEMDRFATLEACLRAEQSRQRAALHEQHVQALAEAHHEREAHLHAALRDLRSAYSNVETANEQLLEALRTSRREAEQLKNSLLASRSAGGGSGARLGGASRRSSSSPGRGRGSDAAADGGPPALKGLALTASELVEQSLRQALAAATTELAGARQQAAELGREQRASDKREQQAQTEAARLQGELARATGLLAEAQAELVAGQERVAELERERGAWREQQRELQFRLGASERRADDLARVDEAERAYVAELARRQRQLERRDARLRALEDALGEWQAACDAGESGGDKLERVAETFLAGSDDGPDDGPAAPSEPVAEAKLRAEMEKRFGDQLGLRVAHERRRVLARLETLCGRERQAGERVFVDLSALLGSPARDRRARLQGDKVGWGATGGGDVGRALFVLLARVVRQAYEDLGVCVGAWRETDLDTLAAQALELRGEVAVRDEQLARAHTQLEVQRLALARSELLQGEKEALLAELTDRCRQLRTALEQTSGAQNGAATTVPSSQPLVRQPLSIYGVPQPLEAKRTRRAASLATSETPARPMSAAPALAALARAPTSTVPGPSRLGALAADKKSGRWTDTGHERDDEREAPEHVRSVLKAQLMRSAASNQQDGGPGEPPPPLGSEGVLEILQRRRQRG